MPFSQGDALAEVLTEPDGGLAFEILDSRTSSRWGEDVLAWIVHYPERLVNPWVEAESARRKMTVEQAAQYRKAFMDELKIGSATAVLFSIHAFGARPLTLAPISKNVTLVDSSGKRLPPIAYEKKLDEPLSGFAQGFVFFPKQASENFRIAVKGLRPQKETLFTFAEPAREVPIATTSTESAAEKKPKKAPDSQDVVVKIPKTSPPAPPPIVSQGPGAEEPIFSLDAELYPPSVAAAPLPEAWDPAPPKPPGIEEKTPRNAPLIPAKQVLDIFLRAWIEGDTDRMYEQLTTDSRARISKELFAKDVLSSGAFRKGLRDGYKVSWEGGGAKVTVSRRVLLMRSLLSKRINFVTENEAARVAW